MPKDLISGKQKVCPIASCPMTTPNGQAFVTFAECVESLCQWYIFSDKSCTCLKIALALEKISLAVSEGKPKEVK